ncbi:hypothetical protein CFI11_19595 [Thalassococcus sp. S3]|nr:hypothetical protein CFI11_19595 [Thalassococcus sp. S3]
MWAADQFKLSTAAGQLVDALAGKPDMVSKSDVEVTTAMSHFRKVSNQVAAKNNEIDGGQNGETGQYLNAVTRMLDNTVYDKQGNVSTARLMNLAQNVENNLGTSNSGSSGANASQAPMFGNVGTVNIFAPGGGDPSTVLGMAQNIIAMIDNALAGGGKTGGPSEPSLPKTVGDTGLKPGESKKMTGMELIDYVSSNKPGGFQFMPDTNSISIGQNGIGGGDVLTVRPPEGTASSKLSLEGLEEDEAVDVKIKTEDGKSINMRINGKAGGKVDIPVDTDAAEIKLSKARGTDSDFTLAGLKITADDTPMFDEGASEEAITALGNSTKDLTQAVASNESGLTPELQRSTLNALTNTSDIFSNILSDDSDLGFGVTEGERDDLLEGYRGVLALIGQSQTNSPDILSALTGVQSAIGEMVSA